MKETPPPLTPVEMTDAEIELAEAAATRMGYEQTAYTSSSGLWGLFCLNENPETHGPRPLLPTSRKRHLAPYAKGCFIKTAEFGLMFVQGLDDLNMHDLEIKEQKGACV